MTTQTTQTSQVTYRRTKNGEWVAYGPAHILEGAMLHNLPVTVTKRDGSTDVYTVTRVGRKFVVDGQYMAYGYGHRQGDAPTARRTNTRPQRTRRCATGGNCSSFGDGRSCGGYDCDGW